MYTGTKRFLSLVLVIALALGIAPALTHTGNACGGAGEIKSASGAEPPVITIASLPDGKIGEGYLQSLTASGTLPVTWSISANMLPPGLFLDGDRIAGIPTADGTYHFTLRAVNSAGKDERELTITIMQRVLPFTDIRGGEWYFEGVYFAFDRAIMLGIGGERFGPGLLLTRAEAVTVLWRFTGSPAATLETRFNDVDVDKWYARAVSWAVGAGIAFGRDGSFYPGGRVTREDFIVMLHDLAKAMGEDVSVRGDISDFADADSVSASLLEAVSWAYAANITEGDGRRRLNPCAEVTRAEAAVMLKKLALFFE